MGAGAELERLLARPSPLLLPWLARRVAMADLPIVASAAAPHQDLLPGWCWPVVADATAAVLAERGTDDLDLLHRLLRVLPPIAAYLAPEVRRAVSWDAVGADARTYAAIADERDGAPPAAVESRPELLRPPARAASLALLGDVRAGRPVAPSPDEAAYLLPFVAPAPEGWAGPAVTALVTTTATRPDWYPRAVAARVLPLLDAADVDRVATVLDRAETARLQSRHHASPEEELAAAYGDVAPLTELAGRVAADLVAELCRAAAIVVRDEVDPIAVYWHDGQLEDLAVDTDGDGLADFGWRDRTVDTDRDGLSDSWSVLRDSPSDYSVDFPSIVVESEKNAVAGRPVRHLNVRVVRKGGETDLEGPLPADTDLDVLCSVGALDPRGLTAGADDATFPDEFLPDTALDLTVVLTVGATVRTTALPVPAHGDSGTVRLPLAGRPPGTVVAAELGLYYEVTLIQLVALILPVEGAAGVPTATITYRLSTSLADLTPFADRSMSVSVSTPSGRSRLVVNGTAFEPGALLAESSRVDTAVRAVRTQLYEAHFRLVGGREVSRFDRHRGKPVAELIDDLGRLAWCGRKVYLEMFGSQAVARGLPAFLRAEGRARRRPPVIQVVDPGARAVPVPWAAVYDLPLGSDPVAWQPCPSLRDLGGGDVPVVCPYEDDHLQDDGRWRPDQLCPWGFWGLSTLLEHPPHVVGRDLPAVVGDGSERVFLAADGPDLDDPGRRAHVKVLRTTLGQELKYLDRPTAAALGAALGDDADVVYLFCHCGRDALAAGAPPDLYLHFDRRIAPTDVNQWIETEWPVGHWSSRHPLVVINGCHTTETLSGSLSDFVVAFTSWTGGAGVIGTEVTVDQPVAAWAMELFLDALRSRPVGEALRATRWAMLGRGNVMGMAYTPYCLATLTLRERSGAA